MGSLVWRVCPVLKEFPLPPPQATGGLPTLACASHTQALRVRLLNMCCGSRRFLFPFCTRDADTEELQ